MTCRTSAALSTLALALLVEQARVLHGDYRLLGDEKETRFAGPVKAWRSRR